MSRQGEKRLFLRLPWSRRRMPGLLAIRLLRRLFPSHETCGDGDCFRCIGRWDHQSTKRHKRKGGRHGTGGGGGMLDPTATSTCIKIGLPITSCNSVACNCMAVSPHHRATNPNHPAPAFAWHSGDLLGSPQRQPHSTDEGRLVLRAVQRVVRRPLGHLGPIGDSFGQGPGF